MEAITQKTAVQIIEQTDTNSVPFLVLCDDGELYYAKTTFKKHPPLEEIVNEILCVYALGLMGVKTIKPALIAIPQEVFEDFKLENKAFSLDYNNLPFNDVMFVGSLLEESTTEVEVYNTTLKNKFDYNKYKNPTDFLKIGVFDYWIGNMDRRGSNPNILVKETADGKFEFLPIDHTQAFAYQSNYKALRLALMSNPHPKSILRTPMSKSIISFADSKFMANFHNEILADFENVINNLDFVFDQIPNTFGLSKKGRKKIVEILSNKERNILVSKIHLNI
ncbi:HipA family kinase [Winogradskyella ursingii]|uniref:HipA family kinase n=1 Tax=Winogradskyella ursingii TaxID=2686079 RepID=UPI0015CD05BE|nr:HipA family kinase [Winogradskyella ursingii]